MPAEPFDNPVLRAIRKFLPGRALATPFLCLGFPLDPHKVPFWKSVPQGLRFLHAASSVPEADMLTQVLIDEGFHIEFVPSVTTGVFGTTGNSEIYVPEAEYDRAAEFLKTYLGQ